MSKSYGHSSYMACGYAGKTVSWCPSDDEHRFEQNMTDPKQRKRLENNGWSRDSITYTFNKDGFRSEEFTYEPSDSVLFLGCSLTVGIGMRLEDTWAYKVATTLGLRRYNLGVGASSADTCFRLAYHWIPRLRPKYVVMLTPDASRKEVVLGDAEIANCMPNMAHCPAELSEFFYNNWLLHPANADMNRLKNVMGVQTICNGIGVPLVEMPVEKCYGGRDSKESWIRDLIQPDRVKANIGRDLMHPGSSWHDGVADRVLVEIDKNLQNINLGA